MQPPADVVEHAKNKQRNHFHQQKQKEHADGFTNKQARWRQRRRQQGVQALVRKLARKSTVKHQRTCKRKRQPQQAGRELVNCLRKWIESETEQDENGNGER